MQGEEEEDEEQLSKESSHDEKVIQEVKEDDDEQVAIFTYNVLMGMTYQQTIKLTTRLYLKSTSYGAD